MTGTSRALSRYGMARSHGKAISGRGLAKPAPKPKRSAHNVCDTDNGGCGHFRSDHRASHECRVQGCECEEMVW